MKRTGMQETGSVSQSHLSTLRRRVGIILAVISVVLLAALGAAQRAQAQTAHFSGAVRPLNTGPFGGEGLAVDGAGNVFLADFNDGEIKEFIAANGRIPDTPTILTLASGLSEPSGIAVDGNGNVFFSEFTGNDVKEIPAAGGYSTVTTIAGGLSSPEGIAVDTNGNVYVVDTGNNEIKEIEAVSGAIPSSPTVRSLVPPSDYFGSSDVDVDNSGNVFFNNGPYISEVLAVNGSIPLLPTIANVVNGLGTAYGVTGISVDASGNVFVVVQPTNSLNEILAVNGSIPPSPTVVTVASGLDQPFALALEGNGNIYVTDNTTNHLVKEVMPASANFGSLNVGSESASPISLTFTFDTAGTLGSAKVVTQGAPGLDFIDAGTGACQANTAYNAGDTCTVDVNFKPIAAGSRDGAAELLDGAGNVIATGYVQGTGVGPEANFLPGTVNSIGSSFVNPYGVAADQAGNVYVADASTGTVFKETLSGSGYTQGTIGSNLQLPIGVAVDGAGNVYVTDETSGSLVKETFSNGSYTQTTILTGFGLLNGVAVDGSGNLYLTDSNPSSGVPALYKETLSNGEYIQSTVSSGFGRPFGVAVDGDGNVYVADTGNARCCGGSIPGAVYKETLLSGQYTQSTIGSGWLQPIGVSVGSDGNVYVADLEKSAVFKETLSNDTYTQSIVADGFVEPAGLALDANGNILVGEVYSNVAYDIDLADPPGLSFAATAVGSTSTDSPQTVLLQNIGNADLTFPIPATGNNPSIGGDFTLDSSSPGTCPLTNSSSSAPGTLPAGRMCTLPITFAPQTAGNLDESLTLMDNNLNKVDATQVISLSGTAGGLPTASLTPANLSFAGQLVGNTDPAQTVTLSNTSASKLTLTIDSISISPNFPETTTTCGASLAQGDSCTISVAFAPTTTGGLTGTLTIQDNASTGSGQQTVTLSGTGLLPTQYVQDVMVSQVTGLGVNPGQTNSLVTELQQATTMISAGKINGAIGNLEGFIAHVNGLLNAGALNSGQASTLINAAESVIAQLK